STRSRRQGTYSHDERAGPLAQEQLQRVEWILCGGVRRRAGSRPGHPEPEPRTPQLHPRGLGNASRTPQGKTSLTQGSVRSVLDSAPAMRGSVQSVTYARMNWHE